MPSFLHRDPSLHFGTKRESVWQHTHPLKRGRAVGGSPRNLPGIMSFSTHAQRMLDHSHNSVDSSGTV